MSASQDFVALDWIKGEIANTLQQAQTALESAAEDPSDATSMRSCLTALHQVHGTLRMVELEGPTQVAEEMETLAQALMNQAVDDVEGAQEVLMQAILQVPSHLERIQRDQADNPVLLLPIVNNLRTMRGEAVIESGEEGGAAGDRFAVLAEPGPEAAENFEKRSGPAKAVKLRQRYRQALQQILRKVKTRDNLTLLGKVFNNLDKLCGESAMGYLGMGGVALIEAVASGALRFDNRVVSWLRDVDRSLSELGARGSDVLAHGVEVRQIESLLELFEQAPKSTPRMEKFADVFPLPAPAEQSPGVGPDPEAVAAVVAVMLEELRGVTEKLDLFVRSDAKDLSELAGLIPVLEQMSSTLLVVEMGDHRRVVEEQIQALRDIEGSGTAPDEKQLIQIAGAFLQITSELSPLAGEAEDGDGDSFADLDEAQAAVVREIRNGLAQCKDAVIEFISSDWDRAKLEDMPEILHILRGSLTIVNQQRCGDVLAACATYCTTRLLERPDVTPELDEMDDLADAITSVDYYFERLLENATDPYMQMIEVAETSVARLSEAGSGAAAESVTEPEAPVAAEIAAEPPAEATAEEAGQEPEAASEMETETDAETQVAAEVAEDSAAPSPASAQVVEPDVSELQAEDAASEYAALASVALEDAVSEDGDTVTVAEGAGEVAPQAGPAVPDDASAAEVVEVEAEPEASAGVAEASGDALLDSDTGFEPEVVEGATADDGLAPDADEDGAAAPGVEDEISFEVEDTVSLEADDDLVLDPEDDVSFEAEETHASDAADSVAIEETDAVAEATMLDSVDDIETVSQDAGEPDPGEAPSEGAVEAEVDPAGGIESDLPGDEGPQEALQVPSPDTQTSFESPVETGDRVGFADDRTHDAGAAPVDVDVFDVTSAAAAVGDTVSIDEPESLVDATDGLADAVESDALEETSGDDDGFGDFELEDIDFGDELTDGEDDAAPLESAVLHVEPELKEAPVQPAAVETVGAEPEPVDSPFEVVDLASELTDRDLDFAALENIEIETVDSAEEENVLTLFVSEASDQVVTIQAFIDGPASTNPMPADVVAALHTLRGSASMANVSSVHRVAGALEDACLPLVHANEPPQTPLVLALQEGLLLVQRALSDPGSESTLTDAVDDYEQRVQQLSAEPAPTFDLSSLVLIPQYEDVLDRWDSAELDALVEELANVSEQAADLGVKEALALSGALLNVYEQLTAAPEGSVRTVLNAGHEELIGVLDQIAAGQQFQYDVAVVNALQNIDLAAEQDAADRRLFINEAWDALGNVEAAISKWQADISNQQPLEVINQQLSAVENMAGQYDQPSLVAVIEPMIQLCERLVAGDTIASQEDAELLILGRQDLITQLGVLREGRMPEPEAGLLAALAGRLQAQEEAPDETLAAEAEGAATPVDLPEDDLDDVDEEILAIFIEEADELVEEIDESINEWSTDTGTDSHLKNLLRHLHTLKGGARLAGLASLGEYTHDFETFLIGVQNKPVDLNEAFFALINQRQDEITRRLGIYRKLAAGEASADDLRSLTSVPAAAVPVPAAAAPADVVSIDEPPASAEAPEQDTADAGPTASGAAPAQEKVRVGADLLEELIILAGESSITRGRVEQQISDFGDSLNEMEETINRIREQVRRLEIEAESRETLIRTQTPTEGDSAFDDLEMDRYTMLQQISRSLTEGASDMLDLKDTLVDKSRDAETLLHQQGRIGAELQEGLTQTRMVPFARLIPRLRRIVRQISTEVCKSVRFDAFNVEGEIDRSVLERIVAPLEHMLRNAVDHGIESVDGRRAANKPETGRISLRLSREGGYFVLEISDDGAGIDVGRVKEKAIERGLVAADTQLSDHEIMQFIMKAGFSTAQQLTQISGRGVGMDVVDSEIKQLGGTISVDSTLGVGTEFVIRLPFTVSINRALMVVVKEETYAVPLNTIEGIVRVSPYELDAYYQPDAPMFEYAGQPYRLTYMGKVLERSDNPDLEGQVAPLPVILARTGDNAIAMQVDRVIGSREVVVKALGKQFSELDGVSGATVLGDGSVVIILDVMALVRGADAQETAAVAPEPEPVVPDANRVRTVMIVDDSVTVRKVTSCLMERQGWEVSTARDGVDAVNQLQDTMPDVVLLDIEMRRMDGFEVLRTVRRDPRLAELPIIMITSRTGEKHQQQALELGVNRFLGKPFQEANLLQTIDEVLASAGG